jgi:FeS assembly protein IscX
VVKKSYAAYGVEHMKISWTDTEEIGIQLAEKYPDIDPLSVRFTDLHKWVTELPDFEDDPKKSNEKILEAIQMAWLEERG